jgi:hypothetical protein
MNYAQMNIDNIGYSRPIHTKKGYNIIVNYAGKKPITITTPVLDCPYGVDLKIKENDKSMSMGTMSSTMKLKINDQDFMQLLRDIDDRNTDLPDMFGLFSKADTDTNLKTGRSNEPFYYTPFIEDQSTFRVRIPIKNNKRYDVIVNSKNEAIDYNLATVGDIVPGSKIKCVLEWKHIWIIDRTFGYFWTVKEIEIL